MDERQAIYQNRDIITVVIFSILHDILVDDLKGVVVDIGLIDQRDVLRSSIIPFKDFPIILLDGSRFLDDIEIRIGDMYAEF